MVQETQLLAQAREAFLNGEYEQAESLLSTKTEEGLPQVYRRACEYMLGKKPLPDVWNVAGPLLRCCTVAEMAEIRTVLAICTAHAYRQCNDTQKEKYESLNGDVNVQNKEKILAEIQKTLQAADAEYRQILQVMYGFSQIAAEKDNGEQTDSSFLEGVLKYMNSAVDIQTENGLEKAFPMLDMAKWACLLDIPEEETELLEMRSRLLAKTLTDSEALAQWDFFEPYAKEAGISRKSLEKKKKRKKMGEKLCFWKPTKG